MTERSLKDLDNADDLQVTACGLCFTLETRLYISQLSLIHARRIESETCKDEVNIITYAKFIYATSTRRYINSKILLKSIHKDAW